MTPLDPESPPTSIETAFDLSTPEVQQWEVEGIRRAWQIDRVQISRHAVEEACDDDLEDDDIHRVIMDGRSGLKGC